MEDRDKTREQLIEELAELRRQIGEFQAAEASHRRVESVLGLYETIVSVTKDRLAFVDRHYVYQAANLSYSETCNKSHDEVLGHTVAEVLGKEAFEDVVKGYLDKCFAGESVRYQSWFNSPSTGQTYMDVQYHPFIDADGTVTGVVVSSRDITDRKHAENLRIKQAAALAKSEELQRSRQRIIAAQESMRKQMAQQLHGTVQNKMILILHQLSGIQKEVTDAKTAGELDQLRQSIENLLEIDIRTLSHQLYPSILRRGLVPALQSLGDQLEMRLAIDMRLDEELVRKEQNEQRIIPEIVRLAVYRIVEESLNNVIKHSSATGAIVQLDYTPDRQLQVRIEDNGQGFDVTDTSSGLGMAIIQGYADITGGSYVIHSTPGTGTEITATLPLKDLNYRALGF